MQGAILEYVPTGSVPGAWFQVLSSVPLLEALTRVSNYGHFSLYSVEDLGYAFCGLQR